MSTRAITEAEGVHHQWYVEARQMTLEKLPDFLKRLTTEYQHDYGTIVHAIAAASVATAWAMNAAPGGGITGFQAGAVGWSFIDAWGSPHFDRKIGAQFQDLGDLLFPQYRDKFCSISAESWEALQKAARERLAEEGSSLSVRSHWQSIVNGVVPFGLKVRT